MLRIRTFDNQRGGNVIYKALAHPLAAEAMERLYARIASAAPVVVFDPDDIVEGLFDLYPHAPDIAGVYAQSVEVVASERMGQRVLALNDLPASRARSVLIAAFDAERIAARIARFAPAGAAIFSLDEARLPAAMLTNSRRYLDPLNFATNFAFFREETGLSTRLVSGNYWSGYGAGAVRLWLRLYDRDGRALATWEEPVVPGPGGILIDSAAVRARFDLAEFTGQLFIHAIGAAGHDVVKYALDTYGRGNDFSLSCTHDANAWPADRYAGLPAPAKGERVILWVQNSHAAPIPPGSMALDRMGTERPVPMQQAVPGFASVALDVSELLPGLAWPAQIELHAGRHVVRPRYEIVRNGRTRIAHLNIERTDLVPDPKIPTLGAWLGRGFLLPVPVLPRGKFCTLIQPNPMATTQTTLPVRLDIFEPDGRKAAEHFLGCLKRDHAAAVDLDALLPAGALADGGHVDLVYDFRDGGEADGWLHTIVRAEHRDSGHVAESSFGAHIFNTAMTYRSEPQSYSGTPPGLSTRLFLRLGDEVNRCFTVLIYPASAEWLPRSDTRLLLHDGEGKVIAEGSLPIACSGSALVFPRKIFGDAVLERAGPRGYVLIRDTTCRLFGYHGLMDDTGRFSLDHMFGF
jgi:hypothetical protein